MKPLVTVLVALVAGASVQAQPPDIEGLRVRAEQGNPSVQFGLGRMYRLVPTWQLRIMLRLCAGIGWRLSP